MRRQRVLTPSWRRIHRRAAEHRMLSSLQVGNPVPSVKGLSPSSGTAGAAAQTLTITGTNFLSSSTVTYNGEAHTPTFVNSTQLTILLSLSDQVTGGNFPVVVANPAPGGGTSTPLDFTVDNLVPTLSSVSPGELATGSPNATITLNGTNFVGTSRATVNGSPVTTEFVTASQLTATVPQSPLSTLGSLEVAVENPRPGGGTSSQVPISVVTVASFAVLSVPQTSGVASSSWVIAAAAVDPSGNPIAGLPVNVTTTNGTLGSSAGLTDSVGAFGTTLSPPTGSSSTATAVVSATVGGQTATAVISFAGSATSPALRFHHTDTSRLNWRPDRSVETVTSGPTTTFYSYSFAVGGAGGAGSVSPFAAGSNPGCYSNAVLTGQETAPSNCSATLMQDNATLSFPNLQTEVCQADTTISTIVGIGNCVGAAAIPVGCAIAAGGTAGLGALVCGGTLTAPEISFAIGCAEFIAGLFAKSQLFNLAAGASSYEVDVADCSVSPLSCANAGLDALGIYCTASAPPPPQPPPSSSESICPPGTTCIYVANGGSNTVSVFDTAGNPLPVPAGAFPNLSGPDGFTYSGATGYLYASNTGNKTITVYDLNGNQVHPSGGFPLPNTVGNPEDIVYDAFNGQFYVNDRHKSQIYVYDGNGSPVTLAPGAFPNVSQPWGVTWNPLNNLIYVSNGGTGNITAYDGQGNPVALPGSFNGLQAPDDFTVDPSNGNLYVTEAATEFGLCAISGIVEFDFNGNRVTPSGGFKTVVCPDGLTTLATTGVGAPELLYVANVLGNSVTVYDENGNDLTSQVAPGGVSGAKSTGRHRYRQINGCAMIAGQRWSFSLNYASVEIKR